MLMLNIDNGNQGLKYNSIAKECTHKAHTERDRLSCVLPDLYTPGFQAI